MREVHLVIVVLESMSKSERVVRPREASVLSSKVVLVVTDIFSDSVPPQLLI